MTKKMVRSIIAVTVLVTTVIVFVAYFIQHPEVVDTLKAVPLSTIGLLFLLYIIFVLTLGWIQHATLELCDLHISRKESTLLVMYSSIINFFGPLQSGPAFRAAYLKKKHNISLKRYTLATLVYYGLYALFSGFLLLSFAIGWIALIACPIVFFAAPLVLRLKRFKGLHIRAVVTLASATLVQVLIWSVIYFVELKALFAQVTYLQSLAYTGAANFAMFVSLTPGAIGFRESFLVFSQKLHDISNNVIAAASVLDRSVYIIYLLLMAAFIFGIHANDYFKKVKIKPEPGSSDR